MDYGDALENLFGSSFNKANAQEGVRLVNENKQLKKEIAEHKATISTLRESKKFYQQNYRKAKDAYLREVDKRRAAVNAHPTDEEIGQYVRECAEHETVKCTPFMSFSEWRAKR